MSFFAVTLRPRQLTTAQWQVRHRFVLATLSIPAAPTLWFLTKGTIALEFVSTYILVVLLQAILALTPRIAPPVRQIFAAGSLFTAGAVAIESSGRIAAAHLVLAVILCTLTLYQDWVTYAGGLAFVALYHLGLGVFSPEFIYPPGLIGNAATSWSLTFFGAALLTSLVCVVGWVLSAQTIRDSEALKVALAEAGLRERQARELNDTVVQHLATAVYASDEGDLEAAAVSARQGLVAARVLVASLRAPTWLHDSVLLRDDPSQPQRGQP